MITELKFMHNRVSLPTKQHNLLGEDLSSIFPALFCWGGQKSHLGGGAGDGVSTWTCRHTQGVACGQDLGCRHKDEQPVKTTSLVSVHSNIHTLAKIHNHSASPWQPQAKVCSLLTSGSLWWNPPLHCNSVMRFLILRSPTSGCISHPGRFIPIPTAPKGSNRAPGGTAPGGSRPGIPAEGSKPERGKPERRGSTIMPPGLPL